MERKNLWAPWRMKYIKGLISEHECFLCHYRDNPENDAENYVLWRTEKAFVVFNRFPYNNGHLLIAPLRHVPDLDEMDEGEMLEMVKLVRDCKLALSKTVNPHGFNVGLNIGRCAGAGLPGHLHFHIVPRWTGDTNFMSVLGDTDVISQGLTELYDILKDVGQKEGLPRV